jgi:hypothetical protein
MNYATLEEVKAYMNIEDASYDKRITMDLELVNSEIEDYGEGLFTQVTPKLTVVACRWTQMLVNKNAGVQSESDDGTSTSFANTEMPLEVKGILERYLEKLQKEKSCGSVVSTL